MLSNIFCITLSRKQKEMKNSEQSAYPVIAPDYGGIMTGLSKREYFAAMAMQGILSANSEYLHGNVPIPVAQHVAIFSIAFADELLKQLEQ